MKNGYLSGVLKTWQQNRLVSTFLLAFWGFTILLALIWPMSGQKSSKAIRSDEKMKPTSIETLKRDKLAEFATITRWGKSLDELRIERAAERGATNKNLNPELEKIGFVGLILQSEVKEMLLQLTEKEVQRFQVGDPIPDGRILEQIDDNALTLVSEDGTSELLLLFPAIPTKNTEEHQTSDE
jgi:hypothetical protein